MSIPLIYISVCITASVASIATVSRGAFFSQVVKFILSVLTIIVLIAMAIVATINFSWVHILGLVATYLGSLWIVSFVWVSIFYRHK